MEKVIKTNNGIFIRTHKGFGAIAFSPFSGLFFAINENHVVETLDYCENRKSQIHNEIKDQLGIGSDSNSNTEKESFIVKHYLPSDEPFLRTNELPHTPIVINWLISSKCNCKCAYCYADDVIDKDFDVAPISETVKHILDFNPLAVVISGGEPFLEREKLHEAINGLGGNVGIIVDTNGLIWDDSLVELFIKFNVVVRVSLDSLNEGTNTKIRKLRDKSKSKGSLSLIAYNISKYRNSNVPVLVHTVVTSHNKNSLSDLAIKLPALNVNGWRLFYVIKPNNIDVSIFNTVMNYRNNGNYDEQITDIKSRVNDFKSKHLSKSNFSIEVIPTSESSKNSVVLVLPNGKISTENKFVFEKIEIKNDSIFNSVDIWGHYERYLGKI
jgi:sulfatase maturation enzyme AslB (radical SAM superfamily)